MQYFSENDTVAVIEGNANFFRVYDADSMLMRRQFDIKVHDRTSVSLSSEITIEILERKARFRPQCVFASDIGL